MANQVSNTSSSGTEANRANHTAKSKQTNVASLLYCTAAFLSICLSLFNAYLLAWIWSKMDSLPASHQPPSQDVLGGHERPAALSLEGRLASAGGLSAAELRAATRRLQLVAPAARGAALVRLGHPTRPLIVLSDRKIAFPSGFAVWPLASGEGGVHQRTSGAPHLQCRAQEGGQNASKNLCLLASPQLRLTNQNEPIDFLAQSIRSANISAKRLHSKLQKLQLFSQNHIRLLATSGPIEAQALDTVRLALGGPNSTKLHNNVSPFSSPHLLAF